MTFSIQHNPYLSMYQQLPGSVPQPPPPTPSTDCALPRKGFRPALPSRLQTLPGLDLVTSLLASCRANSNNKSKVDVANHPVTAAHLPYPPINPLLISPSWFQQALMNSLGLPRPFVDDTCIPQNTPRLPPPPPPAPDASGSMPSPKLPRIMVPSPVASKSRTSSCDSLSRSEKEGADPLLYCRSTFYPLLKDQVDRAHSSWRTSDAPRPVTSDPIQETGTLVPSLIDGEVIMGFNVWGEKRLCLPHLFRFVLNDVDLKAIDEACTKLQITCTTCTPAQLKLLHSRRILPKAVSTCGLIRKSDAERLTKFLRNRTDPNERTQGFGRLPNVPNRSHSGGELEVVEADPREKREDAGPNLCTKYSIKDKQNRGSSVGSEDLTRPRDSSVESSSSNEPIPVLHECFGRQSALIHPHLYTEPTAKCIECQTCHRFFAPDQFVGHTHTVTEVDNLNHWGFDSNNWRCYLRLHTGRRVGRQRSNAEPGNSAESSEDELDASPTEYAVNAETHRRLEEFKIKFAQPIRLPPSLSAALRTVGLCASVAPIPPVSMFPPNPMPDQLKTHQSCAPTIPPKNPQSQPQPPLLPMEWNSTGTASLASPVPRPPPIPSNLSSVILPQLTLRRLWAPNDGRIKVPPPPKPIAKRDQNVLPKNLHTGPPLLLHSHRVVSQAAADQYDRDFIPNVCLMPVAASKCRKSSCSLFGRRHRNSRGYPCKHMRNLSSGSRSRSCSSGSSSSSRTRSASLSSTTSSCYSQAKSSRRNGDGLWRSPFSHESRSSSTSSSIQVDDPGSSWCAKKKELSMSSTWSDSSTSRPQDRYLWCHVRRRRRRYRSTGALHSSFSMKSSHRLLCRRVRSSSPILCSVDQLHRTAFDMQHPKSQRLSKTSACSTTSCSKGICSPASSDQQLSMKQRRNRAMAAAKAAQGAASRISPGLWSRHFTNLKRNNGRVLQLPNARQSLPSTARPGIPVPTGCGTGTVPLPRNASSSTVTGTTPVLVTGPNTNSLPAAVLALEAIWADLVRHINEYTFAVESGSGAQDARQRLFEQFLMMQTCYASHIAALMSENQKLHEKLASLYAEKSDKSKSGANSALQKDQRSGSTNWPRSCSMTMHDTGPRATESSSAKDSQAPKQLYPHRSRKEPQPTRTHFSTPCGSSQFPGTKNPFADRRFEGTTRTPDNRLRAIDITEPSMMPQPGQRQPGPDSFNEKLNRATLSDISPCRERTVEIPASATSSSEKPNHIPSAGTCFKPVSQTDRGARDPWPGSELSSRQAGNDLDNHVLSQSVHSTSSAPYKVSSGLCNRRLSEKYKSEKIPWKRRAWDLDGQRELYGSMDLSVQSSCEPTPKRRAVVQDNTGCEDDRQLSANACVVIP